MSNYKLRFRQIHLDFHTSGAIPRIGEKFDKAQWQECLRVGHVNSVTCFSKCGLGWSYHPTRVGKMHPHLSFNLLRAQMEACKEIGVNVPIYISAGIDNVAGSEHPEWREVSIDGRYAGWTTAINAPGFISMCFNSPYVEYLCDQIREAVEIFPEADGVFLDIIDQDECCCPHCMVYMKEHGLDAENAEDRRKCARAALENYYRKATAACRMYRPDMPILHNSGHIAQGDRGFLHYFSHLELESLPTGGWGYDHFPMSARYARNLGLDYLGMTGKFHASWGEFGGYKHPNALRYECAQMIAHGAKCSVGDQLHPNGMADPSTYAIIGAAYKEVEEKEPWCDNVTGIADIAVLFGETEANDRNPDTGASRVLLESHLLFDLVDRGMDISKHKLLILPDVTTIDDDLKAKVDAYLAADGKLLLTGKSGLRKDGSTFAFDIGAEYAGESPFQPDYLQACDPLAPSFVKSPIVMYLRSQQVRATDAEILADVYEPYFNMTWRHFCSHFAPAAAKSEYAGAVRKGNIVYLAHPIFSIYNALGAVAYREYAANAMKILLGDDATVITNLPSTARVTLNKQIDENRYVLHMLYGNAIPRGTAVELSPEGYVRPSMRFEVIEDLSPLVNIEVKLHLPEQVKRVSLEPQGKEIAFDIEDGRVKLALDEFTCHQMVVLHYA